MRNGLNVEPWEPKEIRKGLEQYCTERSWVKINGNQEDIYLVLVYMPTENGGEMKGEHFSNI